MAVALACSKKLWPAFLIHAVLMTVALQSVCPVHAFFHVEHSTDITSGQSHPKDIGQDSHHQNSNSSIKTPLHSHTLEHLQPYLCVCLRQDDPTLLYQERRCPHWPYPYCLYSYVDGRLLLDEKTQSAQDEIVGQEEDEDSDHIAIRDKSQTKGDAEVATASSTEIYEDYVEYEHQAIPPNQPASSPTIAGSTFVVYSRESGSKTQAKNFTSTDSELSRETVFEGSIINSDTSSDHIAVHPSQHVQSSIIEARHSTGIVDTASSIATAKLMTSSPPQIERHIPSYEQWRKQVLEKKRLTDYNDRKQRKRKPYQESSVDVAIGAEDELGFVFSNLDNNGNGKGGDNRLQHITDQLGNGPDLRQKPSSEIEWIKAEYTKDPKDRFNHASSTCAASVVKASKDATSITAILNEGKDHYMLNKCSTKEKFFVVELCEEILVDTFVLGNYEFFSSTFKEFVVSVNRYPPRDDGWSILGHFQARNTRDAQVFRPSVPQLATYIRFDFISHYGNEYYCPITLLRVYGATALEQLKQEEEEEKRQAEEEKRLAELEKARQAAEAEEAEETEEIEETEETQSTTINDAAELISTNDTQSNKLSQTGTSETMDKEHDSQRKPLETPGASLESALPLGNSSTVFEGEEDHMNSIHTDPPLQVSTAASSDNQAVTLPFTSSSDAGSPSLSLLNEPNTDTRDIGDKNGATTGQFTLSDTTLISFEPFTASESPIYTDVLPPRPSTSPASIQYDEEWANVGLAKITLSPKSRSTHSPKPPSVSKPASAGVGTTSSSTSSTTDSSPHAAPSPHHSSQESVYKNIVNRLKVLELNSSLSYQYLEEQSNVFNEILESNEQKINQLVIHLNEATRRLETLGRKYDQLAYSYRMNVEVEGEKRRQDFINLSSQVHLLGSQVMFQRQLFVVGAIITIFIIVFISITKSTAMHYAIQQSPLGAKLRAISGQRREVRSDGTASSIRIGSVESLSRFDQSTLLHRHHSDRRNDLASDSIKDSPPISPTAPVTSDPNHTTQSTLLNGSGHSLAGSPHPGPEISLQNEEAINNSHGPAEEERIPSSRSEFHPTQTHEPESPDFAHMSSPQFKQEPAISRTPYPTPKNSYGPGRLVMRPSHSNSSQTDYRPDSPVFQGLSGIHDEGQLSDADVAYMSRDMDVGRMSPPNLISMPNSPVMRRLSATYYSHGHHQYNSGSIRPMSSLRMDTTPSLTALTKLESLEGSDMPQHFPIDTISNSTHKPESFNGDDNNHSSQTMNDPNDESSIKAPEMVCKTFKEEEEDIGFVSDSVLDTTSKSVPDNASAGVLGDWERQHGIGEHSSHNDKRGTEETYLDQEETVAVIGRKGKSLGQMTEATVGMDASVKEQRPQLIRDMSSRSKRKSSHNASYLVEDAIAHNGQSMSLDLNIGAEEHVSALLDTRMRPETTVYLSPLERQEAGGDLAQNGDEDEGTQADDDSAMSRSRGLSDKRKKNRKSSLSEGQMVPRRRSSHGRHENVETVTLEDDGLDGDDERSPQVSRKS
ncbi:hypothetical protein BX616_007431 [Lobosporangium transversale]|uniref:SUN domain-containing protein n=1 Tax=Lobosporangium transversale TaxID=64571 RepID=A0A1Y2GU47_9FUNG|nr:hypothetical protein BCR41DRAFT_384881 [Lobosporangium transversale]KAF9914853.1 hypothetical protein BX616_007431 [Lobosporangium transversale]ORZ23769.1 hypothetical protein BCR41DRAFT_384881 [Lobosporangium transversale]|eukprot:XP_021883583.1 hypothetical protein BCR41DRAFT_384881 [Lobosporangium transversale]